MTGYVRIRFALFEKGWICLDPAVSVATNLSVTITSFVVFGWRARLLFNDYYVCEFCVFGWRARLFFNHDYHYYCACFGWRARVFLITTTTTSLFCFSGGVCGYL